MSEWTGVFVWVRVHMPGCVGLEERSRESGGNSHTSIHTSERPPPGVTLQQMKHGKCDFAKAAHAFLERGGEARDQELRPVRTRNGLRASAQGERLSPDALFRTLAYGWRTSSPTP